MANPLPKRIDVHSHYLPEFYRTALTEYGHSQPDGMPAIPPWSTSSHLSTMSACSISKSILSISSPGTNLVPNNPSLTCRLTRECNAAGAELKEAYPEKFGYWASLPLPYVKEAVEEIEVVLEGGNGADGFALMTNYHGEYIGSTKFDAVFDRLNEVKAIVFIHPTKPCILCNGNSSHGSMGTMDALPLGAEYPIPMFEFFFDTARAVINLFLTGTVARCPNIKFIIPHAGGCLPPLLTRFINFAHVIPGGHLLDESVVYETLARQFYFDLAGFQFAGTEGGYGQLKALVKGYGIGSERLLYGSDFPFTPGKFVEEFARRMKVGLEDLFDEKEREEIYERNAVKLLENKYR
ncbi:amidohydrolase 2 [Delitschia confertaspora ATCC 74209]|uniref:6-methylsalicylate decarboxylase n=1 Tax=Delitschia confertaspora ATCC 74209 TaxID=1513339 RepID=A0A9P4JIT4_9PLEO|nr:amidohydrolase 2 [Delitschia confertaspora ATCC 74209]